MLAPLSQHTLNNPISIRIRRQGLNILEPRPLKQRMPLPLRALLAPISRHHSEIHGALIRGGALVWKHQVVDQDLRVAGLHGGFEGL